MTNQELIRKRLAVLVISWLLIIIPVLTLKTSAQAVSPTDLILGPQVPIGTSWFDRTQVDRGKFHGRNFPATPPTGAAVDPYTLTHYYDLGMALAIAYKRTGDPEFLTLFRKVEDSWWKLPGWIDEGRVRQFDVEGTAPKSAGIGGLILRAIDGRPEMWDWINAYTRYSLDLWVKSRIPDPNVPIAENDKASKLYIGLREGAFALQYAAWLARALPDSFPLQAGGTVTNGAQLRAQYLADVENATVNYYERLQYTDGSWRWDDHYYTDSDGGQLRGVTQPFMIGLLLDALIDVYDVTANADVRSSIVSQVAKACRHYYSGGPYSTQRLATLNVSLRGFHYFYHGGTTVNPTKYAKGDLPADWNPATHSDVQNQRQPIGLLVAAYGWAFQKTGDPFFKAAGNDLWDSAFGETDGIHNYMAGDGKSYNQNARWGGSFLAYIGGSVVSPTPQPSPSPTATPTPMPTPSPSPIPSPLPSPLPSPSPATREVLDVKWPSSELDRSSLWKKTVSEGWNDCVIYNSKLRCWRAKQP